MRRAAALFFLVILFSCLGQADEDDILIKVGALNDASIEWFDVSLAAVSYLSQVTPNSYMPLDSLEQSGNIFLIQELEEAGYIKKYQTKGLPSGNLPDDDFITLKLTDTGIHLVASIKVHSKVITNKGSRTR